MSSCIHCGGTGYQRTSMKACGACGGTGQNPMAAPQSSNSTSSGNKGCLIVLLIGFLIPIGCFSIKILI